MNKYLFAALFFVGILAIIQVQEPPAPVHPDEEESLSQSINQTSLLVCRGPIIEDNYKEDTILLVCDPEGGWNDSDDNKEGGIVA
jgi:hypothetical protein